MAEDFIRRGRERVFSSIPCVSTGAQIEVVRIGARANVAFYVIFYVGR